MPKKLPLAILTLISATLLAACTPASTGTNMSPNTSKPATREELARVNQDFAKAVNAKDAAVAAAFYTEDAVVMPPNEAPVKGRANIQKYWAGAIAAGAFDVAVVATSDTSCGDLGREVGRFKLSFKDAKGKVTTEGGKYIELLKRDSDGKWKFTYDIWNNDTLALNKINVMKQK